MAGCQRDFMFHHEYRLLQLTSYVTHQTKLTKKESKVIKIVKKKKKNLSSDKISIELHQGAWETSQPVIRINIF